MFYYIGSLRAHLYARRLRLWFVKDGLYVGSMRARLLVRGTGMGCVTRQHACTPIGSRNQKGEENTLGSKRARLYGLSYSDVCPASSAASSGPELEDSSKLSTSDPSSAVPWTPSGQHSSGPELDDSPRPSTSDASSAVPWALSGQHCLQNSR